MASASRGSALALVALRSLLRQRRGSSMAFAALTDPARSLALAGEAPSLAAALLPRQPTAWLHTSTWLGSQGLDQVKPAAATPGPAPLPSGALPLVNTSRAAPTDAGPRSPRSPKTAANDAEECDEALEDLKETHRRVRALERPAPGEISLRKRVDKLVQGTVKAVKSIVLFTLSIPQKTVSFSLLPWSEKKAAFARGWAIVKTEAHHYWIGTKLLGADVRIASRLVGKVLNGKTLTRRERQQLTRTTADMFRLVPMLVFVVIPFMELLLPVALKLFPNMLPSTFEDKLAREEALKRSISARLEIARFLQDTVSEMAVDMQSGASEELRTSAAELYEFMQRVRAGKPVSTAQLLRFAKLFNDELTLDNLERVQLVSLCRFVGISPFGTDAFLRARLRRHLAGIKEDDADIQAEGLSALSEDELRAACRARGMRAPFGEGAADFMRAQLAEWLDWSLNRSLPSSLLLLSRAFTVTSPLGGPGRRGAPSGVDESSLRETLSSLPDEVVEDVELFSTHDGDAADKVQANRRKLELLEREEEMIREEAEAAVHAETPLAAGAHTAAEMTAAVAAAAVVREAAASAVVDALEGVSEEEKAAAAAEGRRQKMRKVVNALAALASSSGVSGEREAFMQLVEKEIGRIESKLSTRGGGMVFTRGGLASSRAAVLEGLVGESRLADKVAGILTRVEQELDAAEGKIGDKFRVLDLDNDGVISMEELQSALSFLREQMGEEELRHMLQELSTHAGAEGGINVNKLMELAKRDDSEDN